MTIRYPYLLTAGVLFLFISCSNNNEPDLYSLSVTATSSEGGTISPESGTYEEGETIEVSATPDEHWIFEGWQGDAHGDANPLSVTMDGDKDIAALFVKREYPLGIGIQGEGTVEERVVQEKTTEYPHGTVVELTAHPDEGWMFSHWEGDLEGDENPVTVTVEGETSVEAVFQVTTYPLTVHVEGDGEVLQTVVTAKSTDYKEGTIVELEAVPDDGWVFSHWEGDLEGEKNPETILIDDEKAVTAVFEQAYALHATTIPEEGGSVNPDDGSYLSGTTIKVEAVPAGDGWRFDRWQGDFTGTTNPFNLTMNEDKTLEALFERREFELNITTEGEGAVQTELKSGTETEGGYLYESVVELTAVPEDGWDFLGWEGDITTNENPVTIDMDSHVDITAVFSQFAGGDGSAGNPFQISTVRQLQNIRDYLDQHFIQISDIDADETGTWNDGTGFIPIGNENSPFAGTYDGSDYQIRNLQMRREDIELIGLFGIVEETSVVKNVQLHQIDLNKPFAEDGNQEYEDHTVIGGLIAINRGQVYNITLSVKNIYASYRADVGGLVGINHGTIDNCTVEGDIAVAFAYVGGLVAENHSNAVVQNCTFKGSVHSSNGSASGFAFRNEGTIKNSHVKGTVSTSEENASGFAEINNGSIENSSSETDVSGRWVNADAYGFIYINNGSVKNSFSKGKVSSGSDFDGPAGFIGQNAGNIIDSYSISEVTGAAPVFIQSNGGQISGCYFQGKLRSQYYSHQEPFDKKTWNAGIIENCYAAVQFESKKDGDSGWTAYEGSGSLVDINNGELKDSYWDQDLNSAGIGDCSQSTLCDGTGTEENVEGLTTDQMTGSNAMDDMPFLDWINSWKTSSGYPVFQWQQH